ncbi:MAG: hypothetical protein RLZZ169_1029 [Pseudomonadota bacterium]|jgi:acyl carrier protein
MKSPTFVSDALDYVRSLEGAQAFDIDEHTDLIEIGLVNSFAIVDLILFIEEQLDIQIDMEDPLLDSVRTVQAMHEAFNACS